MEWDKNGAEDDFFSDRSRDIVTIANPAAESVFRVQATEERSEGGLNEGLLEEGSGEQEER